MEEGRGGVCKREKERERERFRKLCTCSSPKKELNISTQITTPTVIMRLVGRSSSILPDPSSPARSIRRLDASRSTQYMKPASRSRARLCGR